MEGVLIASADGAISRSLAAVVSEGRTVHECSSVSDSLALAAAERMDFIYVDGVFRDGTGEDLVGRLHQLGYGQEVIPVLLSDDPQYVSPFRRYGIQHWVTKPFDVHQVETVMEQVRHLLQVGGPRPPLDLDGVAVASAGAGAEAGSERKNFGEDVDIREISQRFRRLLERSLSREDLVAAFSEGMQEQFDVDNVVVLLPSADGPFFRVVSGNVNDDVRSQFEVPFSEPLVSALIRFGEPLWLPAAEQLSAQNAAVAQRYGERLGVRLLCPVISRGRALALVGLSRVHRYGSVQFTTSLLRLFITFFAKAFENAGLYGEASTAEHSLRAMFDALPTGSLAISEEGIIQYANPAVLSCLGCVAEDVEEQPVERAGSVIADAAREVLETGRGGHERSADIKGQRVTLCAFPLGSDGRAGVLVTLERRATPDAGVEDGVRSDDAGVDRVMNDMSRTLAHNFKNALVPIKTCAELLPERYQFEGFRTSFFEIVRDSIDKIDGWIECLLRFNELPGGQQRTVFTVHEVAEQGLVKGLKAFPDFKVKIERDYAEDDVVNANREAVVHIVYECVHNALDVLQDVAQPELLVGTRRESDSVDVFVEDNGIGLDSETQEAVFRPFFTKKLSGLGLGLTYVRKVASAYGGKVDIGPGERGGTRVTVRLPAAARTRVVSA